MDKIDKIITEAIKKVIEESTITATETKPITVSKTFFKPQDMIVEMARINKNETGKCIFPYNSWELKIWSNDHNPPHFHVLNEGWNVKFKIEDGELLEVEKKGKNSSIFEYMTNNVKEWLNSQCFAQPKLTNKENAILQWEQLHDE